MKVLGGVCFEGLPDGVFPPNFPEEQNFLGMAWSDRLESHSYRYRMMNALPPIFFSGSEIVRMIWRRGGDLNPGYIAAHTLSRRAP